MQRCQNSAFGGPPDWYEKVGGLLYQVETQSFEPTMPMQRGHHAEFGGSPNHDANPIVLSGRADM